MRRGSDRPQSGLLLLSLLATAGSAHWSGEWPAAQREGHVLAALESPARLAASSAQVEERNSLGLVNHERDHNN